MAAWSSHCGMQVRIWHCHSCGVGCSCSWDSVLGWEIYIWCQCGQKKKKNIRAIYGKIGTLKFLIDLGCLHGLKNQCLKSECGILPNLDFVLGYFSVNAVSIKIRAVSFYTYNDCKYVKSFFNFKIFLRIPEMLQL